MPTVFAAAAELERDYTLQRAKEGIASAKARGVKFVRPTKEPPENFGEIVAQWEKGKLPCEGVLRQTRLKHTTFYCRLRE
jgi:DNA invertase Pin-like site-specific DNA recombinase